MIVQLDLEDERVALPSSGRNDCRDSKYRKTQDSFPGVVWE